MHRGLPEGNTSSCFASSWVSRLRLFHNYEIACTEIYMYAHDINECKYDLYNYRATNNWKQTLRIYANLLLPIPTLFC